MTLQDEKEKTQILYTASFDINSQNIVCDGKVIIEKNNDVLSLQIWEDGKKTNEYDFSAVKEIIISAHIGCGSLEAELKDGDVIRLCRFTQSCIKPLSEFIKAVNFYIQTGEYTEIHLDYIICPKCGRRYFENSSICINCADKGSILKKFISYGRKYIPAFAFSGFLILITNVISLALPAINRTLVDGYLFPASNGMPLASDNPVKSVIFLVLLMLAAILTQNILNIIAQRVKNKSGGNFVGELRVKLYNKIQVLSMSSVSRRTTGDLIKRVTSDTAVISDFVNNETVWIVEIGAIFIGVSIYFIATRPFLALLVFLPVPLVLYIASKTWNIIHRRYERQWILGSRSSGILHDIVKGIRVVKVFGTEDSEIKKFSKVEKELTDVASSNEKIWSLLFPALSFLVGVGEFLVLYFGAMAVLGESIVGPSMTLGELIQAISYTGYIYGPLRWMTFLPRSIANAVTSMAKLNEIIEEEPEIKDKPNAVNLEIEGDISFKNVTFGYKAYEPVLKNINLDIKKGEMVGIVGHSGVGKSTMINLIMRLYDVNTGQLLIDGVDIRDIEKENLCNSIGIVFQETFLFAGSIYENIIYAKPNAKPEEVFSAAKIANAHEFIIKFPDAYNTIVGENGHSLSGGERQRIAIARAILRNPSILILDEATASLDTETENKIQEALQRLIKGRTTIAIAHRLSTLRHADRLIVLEKGRLTEQGSHTELLKSKGIYYNLVMAQRQTTKMAEVKKT